MSARRKFDETTPLPMATAAAKHKPDMTTRAAAMWLFFLVLFIIAGSFEAQSLAVMGGIQ